MKITRIIPARVWRHVSGKTASIYGAAPWTSDADRDNWTMEMVGWTWETDAGTVGLGRKPARTYTEAQAVMERVNARCPA